MQKAIKDEQVGLHPRGVSTTKVLQGVTFANAIANIPWITGKIVQHPLWIRI